MTSSELPPSAAPDTLDPDTELRLIAETTWMTESLDLTGSADRLARSVVPALADFCYVDLLEESGSGQARRVAARHRDPGKDELLARAVNRTGPRIGDSDPISEVLTAGEPRLLPSLPERLDGPGLDTPGAAELDKQLAPGSAMLIPLRARGRVLGMLTLCTERPDGRQYTEHDLRLVENLANRAALALDNARLYDREHRAAETLQRSLLPRRVPDVPGLRVATRYLVGVNGAHVGGDWYDLLELPDGAVGLAVGDVVGHDLNAAASMGQLRAVLRSYAWEGLRAGAVLDRCDQLVQGLEMAAMATATYARLEPSRDGSRQLIYSNAGHPPPLIRRPDGDTRFLDANLSPLLGAVAGVARSEIAEPCPPGSLLLFYTDGLIDVAGSDADERHHRLHQLVETTAADGPVDELAERVLAELVTGDAPRDDVALLAVALQG